METTDHVGEKPGEIEKDVDGGRRRPVRTAVLQQHAIRKAMEDVRIFQHASFVLLRTSPPLLYFY